MKKTNFDQYLEEQLQDPTFADRFDRAGEAWDVALQIAALRQEAGLSQKELAKLLKTSQQQISRLESPGYEGHSLSMLRRVAEALHARVRVVFEPEKKGDALYGAESGAVKLRPGGGKKGVAPPPKKVSVQDMINEIRTRFNISDEEALYIKQVTELKVADPTIRSTVQAHRDGVIYLEGAYRGQVNGKIQDAYNGLARYEELADPKYTDTGGIFDIMAVTVIETHLMDAA